MSRAYRKYSFALELADQPAARLAEEYPADRAHAGITVEDPGRGGQPAGADRRVSVHGQDQIVGTEPGNHLVQRLVQRTRLARGVADRGDHLGAAQEADVRGGIVTVIADHDDPVRRSCLLAQRPDGLGDCRRFVVRRDDSSQSGNGGNPDTQVVQSG
jgi:hypothetical protein